MSTMKETTVTEVSPNQLASQIIQENLRIRLLQATQNDNIEKMIAWLKEDPANPTAVMSGLLDELSTFDGRFTEFKR